MVRRGSLKLWVLGKADHVRKDSVRAWHALGKFAIERVGVVNVNAFTVFRIEKSALLRLLICIMRL